MSLDLRIVQGDALDLDADVLVLKYAQKHYGLDGIVARQLADRDGASPHPLPGQAESRTAPDGLAAEQVLIVGTPPFAGFDYLAVRRFAEDALAWLGRHQPETRSVVLTLHGAGFGLDEIEAFDGLLAGLVESGAEHWSDRPLTVTIAELAKRRARAIEQRLDDWRAAGALTPVKERGTRGLARSVADDPVAGGSSDPAGGTTFPGVGRSLAQVGADSASKPHAFVAMPFDPALDDTYHYGIAPPVRDAGLLCERIDNSHFSGDIARRILERIGTAKLIVVDLSMANPNVYLELGYAWGVGTPVVLLVRDVDELRFDVQGQRCLVYGGSIRTLEQQLRAELAALAGQLGLP